MKILLVGEHRGGALRDVNAELAGAATPLRGADGEASLLLVTSQPDELASAVRLAGVDRVVTVQVPDDGFRPEVYRHAVCEAARHCSADLVLIAQSVDGIAYAAAVAAELDAAYTADAVGLDLRDDTLVVLRQLYGGKVTVQLAMPVAKTAVVTVRPATFPAAEEAAVPPRQQLEVDVTNVLSWTEVTGIEAAARREVDLSAAPFIVGIGRGFEEEKNIAMAEELVERLGAALAASRPVVDAHWLPHDRQVGSSGQTVSPKVYLAIGISGSTQHVAGMRKSETIVAINKDAEAAIFDVADVGVVADLFEIVPALLDRLQAG